MPHGLDETPCIFVDRPEQLVPLVNDLLIQDVIAIDLEVSLKWMVWGRHLNHLFNIFYNNQSILLQHHSFRSFQGFTCLMQISTLTMDYLIDTLALRSQMHILNYVFTNPNTVKVSLYSCGENTMNSAQSSRFFIIFLFVFISRFSMEQDLISFGSNVTWASTLWTCLTRTLPPKLCVFHSYRFRFSWVIIAK